MPVILQISLEKVVPNSLITINSNGQLTSGVISVDAFKQYLADVEDIKEAIPLYLPKTGGTMTGILTLDRDPVNPLDAVSKQYVDKILQKTYAYANKSGIIGLDPQFMTQGIIKTGNQITIPIGNNIVAFRYMTIFDSSGDMSIRMQYGTQTLTVASVTKGQVTNTELKPLSNATDINISFTGTALTQTINSFYLILILY